MTKPSDGHLPAERLFAEEFGVVGESIGMPRMVARLLGWMLVCDPPQQSSAELGEALGVSRASISIATRLLESSRLLRRVAKPGRRGHFYELDIDQFTGHMDVASRFAVLRQAMERGIELVGGPASQRADRLREARDFYAFIEAEVPRSIERYRLQRSNREKDR
jgi:hypothetical protein